MSFLAGWRLLLLLLVASLLLAYVVVQRQRRKYAVRFTNVDLLASVAPNRPGWRRHAAAALLLLGLALSVVAFARPTWPAQVPRERATVMLAFDVSLSMAAEDVEPTRLEAAQEAAVRFVDAVPPKFRVGLVTFGGSASVVVPPVHNRERVKVAVNNIDLQQRTAIGEGIFGSLDAIETIRENGRERKVPAVIVLISDGFTNSGRPNQAAAEAAVELEVPVSTISFGTDGGSVIINDRPIPVPASPEALEQIADATGGTFSEAATAEQLDNVYDDLNSSIGYRTVQREVTVWFVGMGLGFAFVAAGASLFWTSRIP